MAFIGVTWVPIGPSKKASLLPSHHAIWLMWHIFMSSCFEHGPKKDREPLKQFKCVQLL